MKMKFYSILGALGVILCGCYNKDNKEDQVISQRYIHKYGYAVSKDEWEARNYPGQVITTLRNGVTVSATYENGILNGPCTHTFPHSQTIETYFLYNQGNCVKELYYDIKGMPMREVVHLSPTRYTVTLWYVEGTPMSIEEYANLELLEGQYFTTSNETEARVEKGVGKRIRRDQQGTLLSKDLIEAGQMVKRESFYPNGTPENFTVFVDGKIHGERRLFAASGEPLAVEEWVHGKLHGKSTYFKNGLKAVEISYLYGLKNGLETHFLDDGKISQEIEWENDKKHGASTFYIDGIAQSQWYYNGDFVTKKKFDELLKLDEMITQISPDVRVRDAR